MKIGTLLKQMELCLLRRGYRHEEGLKWEFLFIPARLLGRARLLIFKIFPPGTIILQARFLSSTEYARPAASRQLLMRRSILFCN